MSLRDSDADPNHENSTKKKKKQNSIKKKILGDDAVGLDSVLQTVELPAGVAHLDPGLADVYADDLSHLRFELS